MTRNRTHDACPFNLIIPLKNKYYDVRFRNRGIKKKKSSKWTETHLPKEISGFLLSNLYRSFQTLRKNINYHLWRVFVRIVKQKKKRQGKGAKPLLSACSVIRSRCMSYSRCKLYWMGSFPSRLSPLQWLRRQPSVSATEHTGCLVSEYKYEYPTSNEKRFIVNHNFIT